MQSTAQAEAEAPVTGRASAGLGHPQGAAGGAGEPRVGGEAPGPSLQVAEGLGQGKGLPGLSAEQSQRSKSGRRNC